MVSHPHGRTTASDDTTTADTASADTIVASIDQDPAGEEYVIADISEDGAWLSMRATDAPTLPAWR